MANTREKVSIVGKSMAERYPRTISIKLYDAWQLMRRRGDGGRIAKKCKISRPIVDRALNYGNVKKNYVGMKISRFFYERWAKEKKIGDKIIKQIFN